MKFVFRINKDQTRTPNAASQERMNELNSVARKLTNLTESIRNCKDCEEWFCWTCDNENCPRGDKCDPSNDQIDCSLAKDDIPRCKDCDEWQCVQCDNE